MTYEEFCAGTGEDVCREFYERTIEPVYMGYRRFSTKRSFFNFCAQYGVQGVITLARALRREGPFAVNDPDEGRCKIGRIQYEMRCLRLEEEAVKFIYGLE